MELHLDLQCKHSSKDKKNTQVILELALDKSKLLEDGNDEAYLKLSLCEDCLFEIAEKSKRPRSWINIDKEDSNEFTVSQGSSKYEKDQMGSSKFTPNCY